MVGCDGFGSIAFTNGHTPVLDALRRDPELADGFVEWRELPPAEPRYGPFPLTADQRIIDALARRGIEHLYVHQAEAFAAVMQRQSVVVVTPTASGKTLCYNGPVLDAILKDPSTRALYLFPTKALAQDQLAELHALTELAASGEYGQIDEVTSPDDNLQAVFQYLVK